MNGLKDMLATDTPAAIANVGTEGSRLQWPYISLSWHALTLEKRSSLGLLPEARDRLFLQTKHEHFISTIARSATRPCRMEDDYDYPEDLPQIKINRIRAFRAKEAAELLGVNGESLLSSSIFYQLWKELRSQTNEQLRIQYTHPMDDGQARAFKIRFDGEGVDDYGGPYREIFQQVFDELQAPDPSAARQRRMRHHVTLGPEPSQAATSVAASEATPQQRPASWGAVLERARAAEHANLGTMANLLNPIAEQASAADTDRVKPDPCFVPLLLPTPNWMAGECAERYCYIPNPASHSEQRLDLYRFMGQLAGMAVRSHLSVDLAMPSLFWKHITHECLTETDLASIDMPAADFVQHLLNMQKRIDHARSQGSEGLLASTLEEAFSLVQDLTWSAERSDGTAIELLPGGATRTVQVSEISAYLTAFTTARLTEAMIAVSAFREGFITVIPESAFALMTGQELQSIVSGSENIDIARLRQNAEYDEDVSPTDPHILHFWEVLSECTEDEKAAFLRFVWARSSLPPRGTPFAQKFKIQGAVADDTNTSPDAYLPRAHTCFFSLNLPKYSSKAIMAAKLRYAIFNCTEMDADFRLTETEVTGWTAALPSNAVGVTGGED